VLYHRWSGAPILYIYSLRHFLTTKGALIDGDGYPPKMPKNDPKKHSKTVKNWSKLVSKNDQKVCFLMWKSSFSSKSLKLDKKITKNDEKVITIYTTKIGHNLTTKRGDSGSAGTPGEKCVITEAPNLDTKRDKNWSSTRKSDKNWQKYRKCKNIKIIKIRKTWKVTKPRKWKNTKSSKSEKWKSEKNTKNWPPPEKGQNVT